MANLLELLEGGVRLKVSEAWPAWFVNIMERCWKSERTERPGFREVVQVLEEVK